jgi:hypothetical protein
MDIKTDGALEAPTVAGIFPALARAAQAPLPVFILVWSAAFLCLVWAAVSAGRTGAFPADSRGAWKGYTILYVPVDFPEERALGIFAETGVAGVVSYRPLRMPLDTPLPGQAHRAYEEGRKTLFRDRADRFRLFYVPHGQAAVLRRAIQRLHEAGADGAGTDIPAGHPWVPAVTALVVFAFFVAAAGQRAMVFTGGILFALLVWASPEYPVAGAAALVHFGLFLLQKNWGRRGCIQEIWKQGCVPLLWVSAFLICLVFSLGSALFFILAALGSAGGIIALEGGQKYRGARRVFNPMRIRPASLVRILDGRAVAFSVVPGVVILCVFFAFGAFFLPATPKKDLSLPSPSGYTGERGFTVQSLGQLGTLRPDDALPDLGNFVYWVWNTLTFPYRSLHGSAIPGSETSARSFPLRDVPGEVVTMPVYRRDGAGIVGSHEIRWVMDDSFIGEILNALDRVGEATVEQVLKSQGGFVTVAYGSKSAGLTPGKGRTGGVLILLIAAAAISPAATAAFLYDSRKRGKTGSR